jgi:hypothetical protein
LVRVFRHHHHHLPLPLHVLSRVGRRQRHLAAAAGLWSPLVAEKYIVCILHFAEKKCRPKRHGREGNFCVIYGSNRLFRRKRKRFRIETFFPGLCLKANAWVRVGRSALHFIPPGKERIAVTLVDTDISVRTSVCAERCHFLLFDRFFLCQA